MKVIAIIPARGGSKGIPNKNLQKIGKNSLIKQSIIHAKQSKFIKRIIVSTDSQKIKDEAIKNGAEVPFLRPKKISGNNSTTFQVIEHCVNFLQKAEGVIPDIIVILQPTTPFRDKKMIDSSIKKLKNHCTSVISVTNVKMHPSILFNKKNNFLIPFEKTFEKNTIRQKRRKMYCPNGSVYTFWTKNLKKYNSFYGPKISPLIIKEEKLNLDIDTQFELFIANKVLNSWKKFQRKLK